MSQFIFLTANGLAHGAIFAAFALSLVLIWRAARIVNFAQGAIAIAAAYIAYSVINSTGSYWLGFGVALICGAALGVLVERTAMRWTGHDRPLDAVIVALGVVLVIQAALGVVYNQENRSLENPLSGDYMVIGGIRTVSQYNLFVFGAVALLVGFLALLFAKTRLGLRLRASAFAPEVSRLLGINVKRMTTIGWALASGAGALAALLVVSAEPGLLHPNAMDAVFLSAFTAAVIGGLDSPVGAVIGGLALGLVLNYVTFYIDPNLADVAVLMMLLAVLLVRPGGLFSGVAARRV